MSVNDQLKSLLGLLAMLTLWPHPVAATDPLRTALVVNGDAIDSLTIANHYAALRAIPDLGIIVLDDVPDTPSCDVEQFRRQILRPLIEELDRRGLGRQTDLIAYSAGFPTAIDIRSDLDQVTERDRWFTPVASLNGLTTLYQLVLAENPGYASPAANHYARRDTKALLANPFLGSDRGEWQQALADAEAGRFDAAITAGQALLKKHPAQWPLLLRIAEWLAQADRSEDAIKALKRLADARVIDRDRLQPDEVWESLAALPEYVQLLDQLPALLPARMPPVAFSARTTYATNGLPLGDADQGIRHLLSIVLAVTHGRGTTVDEAIAILRRAVSADARGESAEFFFSDSDDVRSTTRKPLVPLAAEILRSLGHQVTIDPARLPRDRDRLMGAMLGSANYDWPAAGNTILPGGIVENLTSTSGVLHRDNAQTPMTELLLAGAAGTSGTVTEPYALPFKFPTPLLYPYYAAGCTLAEAFHLAVESPYQLLIVGDPLCRPFGDKQSETFSLRLTEDDESVRIRVEFWRGPRVAAQRVQQYEVFLDGKLVHVVPPVAQITIPHQEIPPGEHELRIAAVSRHPLRMKTIESVRLTGRSEVAVPTLEWTLRPAAESSGRPEIVATVSTPTEPATDREESSAEPADQEATDADTEPPPKDATSTAGGNRRVAIRHLGRRIVESDGDAATFTIPISRTGTGPVRVTPERFQGGSWILGKPVTIDVPSD